MRSFLCSAGLVLYALLGSACESAPSSCGDSAPVGSPSCQSTLCSGAMRDCKTDIADGCETNTAVDVKNCGACGNQCPTPANGEASCVDGVCGVATCGTRYKDCNTQAADGCEIDSFRDANNCGACGNVCPGGSNATGVCIAGTCKLACQAQYLDCNGNPADGCETNGASDLANCGNCGNLCPTPTTNNVACAAGSCISTMCTGTNQTCKAGPIDGCETDTAVNVNNCGACGKQCAAIANGTPGCTTSNCGIGSCNTGYGNCDNAIANGCETNTTSSALNCGGCGKPCAALANATASCSASTCGLGSCNTGYGDCDKTAANGCESNLLTDAKNCGTCGTVCDPGKSCLSGVCSSCGDGVVTGNEERDPPPGPFTSAVVDAATCRWHFENVVQLYCNGTCTWAGNQDCDQPDADIFCKLRTGNPKSTATSYTVVTALPLPGFPCPGYGVDIGQLMLRGVNQDVYYQDSSILANHGAGHVITNPVCTNP